MRCVLLQKTRDNSRACVQAAVRLRACAKKAAASSSNLKLGDAGASLDLSPFAAPVLAACTASLAIALPALAGPVQDITADASKLTEGFVQGLLLIFFSELGDKTFFIALLLALQRPKSLVFAGTFGALAVMTIISVLIGQLMHEIDEILPQAQGFPWADLLAVVLLLAFGIQTILNAKDAEATAAEEEEEAAEEVAKLTAGTAGLIASTFALVFAAEWGDKSFLATIALAAASSPVGVTAGAVTGHGMATALAVLGGGYLSKNVSETTLQYGGGVLFLAFAAVQAIDIAQKVAGA
jgi:putative Ca2+/H+ antiporter (TMEM165/GDT1 family)